MTRKIVIGSRGSDLALAQSNQMADAIRGLDPEVEVVIEIITSKADKLRDVPLAKIGGKGVFTKELEVALLDGSIDLAVHSLKDLPTELPEGLTVAAIPPREDPRDALIARNGGGVADLPPGAKVATSSLRRQAQLLALRPDLEMHDIRGNVPTRIEKLTTMGYDALVLAASGLRRLGLAEHVTAYLDADTMLPAPGQGALGLETRSDDHELIALLSALNDPAAEAEATAERAVLQGLGGGCQTPLGTRGTVTGDTLRLNTCIVRPDGTDLCRATAEGPVSDAIALGRACAETLRAQGATAILQALDPEAGEPLKGRTILLTRPAAQSGALADALENDGATVVIAPTIAITPQAPETPLPTAKAIDWIVFTSANAVAGFHAALQGAGQDWAAYRDTSICAIGPATAEALRVQGVPVQLTPDRFEAAALLPHFEALEGDLAGKRFLLPRGDRALPILPEALQGAGAEVTECVVYTTTLQPLDPAAGKALLDRVPDALVFTSPSTVEGFAASFTADELARIKRQARIAVIGPTTRDAAEAAGFEVTIMPEDFCGDGLATALRAALGTH